MVRSIKQSKRKTSVSANVENTLSSKEPEGFSDKVEIKDNDDDTTDEEVNNESDYEDELYRSPDDEEDDEQSSNEDSNDTNDVTTDEEEESVAESENEEDNKNLVESLQKLSSNGTETKKDEYEKDSSDEEDIRNTVGNIPMNWYDEYKHLGYDWDGKKIVKPSGGDQLDDFLKRMDDPDFWRTVKDPQTGQDVVLSENDINIIKRIQGQRIPDETFEEYAPWIEWFTSQVMEMPLRKFPEHKRSFLPSKSEAKKVSKLVHALKMGWLKTKAEKDAERAKKDPQFYMLWSMDDQPEEMRRIHKHIPAPKRALPSHAESYNPPAEYLFDDKELEQWQSQKHQPWKRKLHFVPQKYDSLRKVPSYSRYIKERFLRCLDLYLCPRAIKMRLAVEPEALIPKLPSPKDLQPFPSVLAITYEGHKDLVRSISIDKSGQFVISGSDDGTSRIWEVNTGRCLRSVQLEGTVRCVEWCPNAAISICLLAVANRAVLVNPQVGDVLICERTDEILAEKPKSESVVPERVQTAVQWNEPAAEEYAQGLRAVLTHMKEVSQVTWHARGDYFATVMPQGANRSVVISQLSKRRSQLPFTKSKGLVQWVQFHPTKPILFVATQRHIRVYDLVKQQLVKKLQSGCKWISKIDIHPGGDNVLVSTYDKKVLWFDLDLSTKPYQTLRLHETAVRAVAFHKRYPLFASGSDDRNVIVSHGMVYNDLLKNALIVPLKKMEDHQKTGSDFGVLDVKFHPLQPWLFTASADYNIRLYTN